MGVLREDSWFIRTESKQQQKNKKNKRLKKNILVSFSISYKSSTTSTIDGTIGVLSLEVASLMSKIINFWHSLSDDQITKLKYEVFQQEGIKKLVSDDHNFLLSLTLSEFMDSLGFLTQSVTRLGKECTDPVLQQFDSIFTYLLLVKKHDDDHLYGFQYAEKKMERKVKKMERIVYATSNLYQELEVLAELEQTKRRLKIQAKSNSSHRGPLADCKHKVAWQRQEIKFLQNKSLWNRTYDYVVRLLARSLFTILGRINRIFTFLNGDVHNDEDEDLSPSWKGRNWKKTKWSVPSMPLSGCMLGGADSPMLPSFMPKDGTFHAVSAFSKKLKSKSGTEGIVSWKNPYVPFFLSQQKPLKSSPSTLGDAALDLHYANVIILIEKLAMSPHLICSDARNELYSILTSNVRASLRATLKTYTKNSTLFFCDPVIAADWSERITGILDWLAPLAHNMIKWQSKRNFEQRHLVLSANMLLLQTLYFANQAKAEDAITELLVGLNYLWRFQREMNSKQEKTDK